MSKYNRTSHLKSSPGATKDDRIAKDSVNLIGKDIIMTEKLDGENNGITKHGVYARSHAEFTKNPWSVKVRQLHSIIGMDIPENVFLFGEGMEAIHSIEYTKLTSPFYLFGIRENDIWWSWNDVEDWAHLLNIPTVPVLFRGKVKSEEELNYLIKTFMENGSMIGGDIEGVVVRTSSEFTDDTFDLNVQKYVRENHVQTTTHWTRNWVKANIQQEYK